MSGTLTIPRNVETIAKEGVRRLGFASTTAPLTVVFETGSKLTTIGGRGFMQSRLNNFTLITVVDIRSNRLSKPSGATANFPLADGLFQGVTGITEIKLPAGVYDSYTSAERSAIFETISLTRVP